MAKSPGVIQTGRKHWHAGSPRDAGLQFLHSHGAALQHLKPISERDYVQRGLDLANWDGTDSAKFAELETRLLIGGQWDAGVNVLQPRELTNDDHYSGQFYRDILIRELSRLLSKPPRVRPREIDLNMRTPLDVPLTEKQLDYARRMGGRVAAILVASANTSGTALGYVYRPENLHAAIDTVLWLLTATDRTFRNELRQCKWDRCFNFFLAEKPKSGGPRLSYCLTNGQPECQEAAHRFNTTDRKKAQTLGITTKQYRANKTRKRR